MVHEAAIRIQEKGGVKSVVKRVSQLCNSFMKEQVFNALCDALRKQLDATRAAQHDAASYATDEESRAESQWDTQATEASYLAAGQAHHAQQLVEYMDDLDRLREEMVTDRDHVAAGALVTCQFDGEREHYYVAPVDGGESLLVGEMEITTITLQSPLGHALLGKSAGDPFLLPNGRAGQIVEIQ